MSMWIIFHPWHMAEVELLFLWVKAVLQQQCIEAWIQDKSS